MAGVSGSDHIQRTHMAPSFKPSLPMMRLMWVNLTLYISFFLATVALSMSAPRDLLLRYIPNAYTSGGVVSWQGAGALGAAAVVVSHLLNVFLLSFLG
jgi:hypothetical protein